MSDRLYHKCRLTKVKISKNLRNDIILAVAVLAVALIALLILLFASPHGDLVSVTVNGELYGEYPLDVDTTVEIYSGEDGRDVNVLIVSEGRASVISANCRDGICVRHRPVSRSGASIVCLPHGVVITVVSDADADIDIVS